MLMFWRDRYLRNFHIVRSAQAWLMLLGTRNIENWPMEGWRISVWRQLEFSTGKVVLYNLIYDLYHDGTEHTYSGNGIMGILLY